MANELQRVGLTGSADIRIPLYGAIGISNKVMKELRFMPYDEFPTTGRENTLYIDTVGNSIYYYDGSTYIPIGGSASEAVVVAKTTAQWAQQTTMMSTYGGIYIYTDYRQENDMNIPAMKIGDGLAYVVDLPFFDTGVTEADRQRWDNKVSVKLSPIDSENLILYTD